jgi:hypothetical protein
VRPRSSIASRFRLVVVASFDQSISFEVVQRSRGSSIPALWSDDSLDQPQPRCSSCSSELTSRLPSTFPSALCLRGTLNLLHSRSSARVRASRAMRAPLSRRRARSRGIVTSSRLEPKHAYVQAEPNRTTALSRTPASTVRAHDRLAGMPTADSSGEQGRSFVVVRSFDQSISSSSRARHASGGNPDPESSRGGPGIRGGQGFQRKGARAV